MNNITDNNHVHLANKKVSRELFWLIWIIYAVVYMTKNCFSAALAAIVQEGVLTKSQTGLITSVFYLVYAPLQVLGGVFADKYNPERMIKIGLAGSGIANLIIFLNQNYYVMLIAWIFNAITQFALWPSVFKIISSQIIKSDRKMGAFYISFASSTGLLLAYIVAAFVTKWQYNFAISAFLLFAFAIILHFVYDEIDKEYMIHDKVTEEKTKAEATDKSTVWIFLASGFFATVVLALVRMIVDQGVKTLSPTILMEMYDNISPSIGNMLNSFIIISGMLGMLLVKLVLYPKYIKDEMTGNVILLAAAIPFALVITLVGKINIVFIIAAMCGIAAIFTAMGLFSSYFNMRFAKFGKDGTAAGICNAGASFGVVLQSYGLLFIAEHFGWESVTVLWVALIVASALLILAVLPMWKRFKKKENI